MHTLNITSITKQHDIAAGTEFLDVAFEIVKDGEAVYEGRHGFPLDAGHNLVAAELEKFVTTYADDQERAITNKQVESLHKQADETIESLQGLEINATRNQ